MTAMNASPGQESAPEARKGAGARFTDMFRVEAYQPHSSAGVTPSRNSASPETGTEYSHGASPQKCLFVHISCVIVYLNGPSHLRR